MASSFQQQHESSRHNYEPALNLPGCQPKPVLPAPVPQAQVSEVEGLS